MSIAISVENVGKQYQLGLLSGQTFKEEVGRWWAGLLGRDNPLLKIGQEEIEKKKIWALRDVTFTVSQGEALGVIGGNGAGKSTLFKILSRITYPTEGQVRLNGRVASMLEVGTGFHPEMTGRDNVFMNGSILGMSRWEIRRKFDEIVEFAGVEKFVDTPVKRYSSGMYVRLAFAVAAHLESEILIVDEVLAVGDTEFQKKCLGKMGDVAHQGRTVLFVSHNMGTIAQLCNRTILIERGKIKATGSTDEVIREYLSSKDSRDYSVDLSKTASRSGTGVIRFDWIRLQNSKGGGTKLFSAGDDIHLVFGVHPARSLADKKVKITIDLRNSLGIKIASMVDADAGFVLGDVDHQRSVGVLIEDIRLYPGRYFLSLQIGSSSGRDVYDQVQDCMSFEIVGGGEIVSRPLPADGAILLMTPKWRVIDSQG